jgi:7,8-dihydroneopterin aldolase/epimerase/oxygenase
MNADKILISKIDCMAAVGVTPEERSSTQRLSIDLEFLIDARKPASSDSIRDTINYAKVAAVVAEVCASQPFHLIETIAERIAERVLSDFPTPGTRVLVRKISPITRPTVDHVSVEIVRP